MKSEVGIKLMKLLRANPEVNDALHIIMSLSIDDFTSVMAFLIKAKNLIELDPKKG